MKIGLDIHGVTDTNTKFFSEFSKAIIAAGGEIHIITGPSRFKTEPFLKEHDIAYTHFFSIVEEAERSKKDIRWEDADNPWIDSEAWNRAKAKYCKEHNIDMHIDDSDLYGQYFKTPYARFYSKDKP